MRHQLASLILLAMAAATPAAAQQVTINFSQPGVAIGINVGEYPRLQRVPGYPVYYAPNVGTNFFFYDGLYWVYEEDRWYTSSWYNGPWNTVDPYNVPAYVLRVPVRYYRHAPAYFRTWRADAPPRWDEHWGASWTDRRSGWDRWDRRSVPAAAPLPVYQRQYQRERYPQLSQQIVIQSRDYRYQPREVVARELYQQRRAQYQETQAPGRRDASRSATSRDDRRGDNRGGPPVRDERGIPAHAKGLAKGHDDDRRGRDNDSRRDRDDDSSRGRDKDDKVKKDKKEKKDKKDKD